MPNRSYIFTGIIGVPLLLIGGFFFLQNRPIPNNNLNQAENTSSTTPDVTLPSVSSTPATPTTTKQTNTPSTPPQSKTPATTPSAPTSTGTQSPSNPPATSSSPEPSSTPQQSPPTPPPPKDSHTMAEVATHNNASTCWSVIDGNVYNLTAWINQHPGGSDAILALCGKNGSAAFHAQHGDAQQQKDILATMKIGTLAQ